MKEEQTKARTEGMLEVCGNLIDLDTVSLTIKINKYLKSMLEAEKCFLFLVREATNDLVTNTFDDVPLDKEIRMPIYESIYGQCLLNDEVMNIPKVSEDLRFNPKIDTINGYEPSTMLCIPVRVERKDGNPNMETIGVAVACNKSHVRHFSKRDEDTMLYVLRFCSSVLNNTLVYQREIALKEQNQALLQVAKNLFTTLDNLDVLLQEIMNEARNLTKAERCSLFLVDAKKKDLVATVFDGGVTMTSPVRIKIGQGIAGYVAKTAEVVNIRDAYKSPKFFKDVDKTTGFTTRNILCFPITDSNGEVVGVAELCNKMNGNFFTKYDEELARTFSVYCGISIYHSRLYDNMVVSQGRSKLASELMLYHMKIPQEDIEKTLTDSLATTKPLTNANSRIATFTYCPWAGHFAMPETETTSALVGMISDMGLVERWKLPLDTLARFVLMVRKGYRDPPYHNWMHAFTVTHFFYMIHQNSDGLSSLTDLERLVLFISCLCHDVDHRGTNNAFQFTSNSVLASLYSSEGSILERHHFSQALCILNSEGCNVFESLNPSDYKLALDHLQANILATDVASHLRKMREMEAMGQSGYDPAKSSHHSLMCCLIMTCCDLSSSCREWRSARTISDLIYKEFFSQGDLEKALGRTPSEMMDRDRAFIPQLQINFLDGIVMPVYKILAKLLPSTKEAYVSLQANRAKWVELKKLGRRPSEAEFATPPPPDCH